MGATLIASGCTLKAIVRVLLGSVRSPVVHLSISSTFVST